MLWLEWKCLVASCGLVQTTCYAREGGAGASYIAICSGCRTVHVADRHSMQDANPRRTVPVDLPITPNGEALHVGPVAFQKAHLPPEVLRAPVQPADGDAP